MSMANSYEERMRTAVILKMKERVANVWRDFCFLVKMLTALHFFFIFPLVYGLSLVWPI